jgi:hypothetical protein
MASVRPVRVAFLTTDATASASELDVNALEPWVELAIVGGDTYGKPVGQLAFDLEGCDDRLRLVSFKLENAEGESDYFDGLASRVRFACAATDTVDRPMGDPADGLTAAALAWLDTGACSSVITAQALQKAQRAAPERYGLPRHPSAAQRWLPGVE